jgi:hypothetical protein
MSGRRADARGDCQGTAGRRRAAPCDRGAWPPGNRRPAEHAMAVVSMSKQEFARLEVLLGVQSGRQRVANACTMIGDGGGGGN